MTSADELWERALQLLARRAHAEAELERKLQRYRPEEAWVQSVLARLRDRGLLDDQRFAQDAADAMVRAGRAGPARIGARLRAAGVADARAVVGELDVDWLARCRALARERASRGLDLSDEKDRARLVRFLAGRGFPSDAIFTALRELAGGAAEEDAGD